ncbi:hypothetical protein HY227_00905 [Candidatus Wolfebacteria bacterium]|nr:hypothetical protein [Candidatus Wolfebacteria bacterium]
MKRKKNTTIIFGLSAVFLALPFLTSALTVGPIKLEYSANPGDTISGTLFLMNEESETRTFYPVFEKFTENNGERQFFPSEASDLAEWFKSTPSVTLKPQEQKTLPFAINVPKNASPGGHYAVIWWSTAPANSKSSEQVAIVTRAGILVYLRVSGDIKESGEIADFSTNNNKSFFWGLPVNFNVLFKNNGNVHLKPQGEIKIKNLFGMTETVLPVNPYGLIALPQSEKGISAKWESGFVFGPYQAQLQLAYGENKTQIAKNIWIFVTPIKTLIAVIIALLLITFGIPRGIRKYNQWIIKRAAKQ